jgi:menaquinone-9 beta-reductase
VPHAWTPTIVVMAPDPPPEREPRASSSGTETSEKPPAKKAAPKRASTRTGKTGTTKATKTTSTKTTKARPTASARTSKRAAPRGPKEHVHDVLVVGGGPAGSSCAYWLADAGWDVAVVEKKTFPREKTCGDGLTPRAVRQLADMGLEGALAGSHRYRGLRAYGFGQSVDLEWPDHPVFPPYGYTITRHDLDGLVAERAAGAGATVLQGTEAVAPLDPGTPSEGHAAGCGGAAVLERASGETRPVRAQYVVVADGANSRFGRALGCARDRTLPLGMALRGYYRSERHDEPMIESHLDIRDADGAVVPGYGWIFPLGDGRVNVGVGLLSTEQRWKGLNTTGLMDAFVAWAPKSWGLSPETSCGPPTGGKLPMGMSVGPHVGSNAIVIGDAGGSINPFNGEGIAYGYETGRLAAASLGDALNGAGGGALTRYDDELRDRYGTYFRVAHAFVRLISNPQAMQLCVRGGMHSRFVMSELLRIMANLMRPDVTGAAEAAYRAMTLLAPLWPREEPDLVGTA